jgi:hypothetical protein
MLSEVEAQCRKDGMDNHWDIFYDRVVEPIMERTEPPSMTDICQKYDIETAAKAANMIVTIKRRFQTTLKQHLRESVSSDEDISEELQELMQFFSKNRAI